MWHNNKLQYPKLTVAYVIGNWKKNGDCPGMCLELADTQNWELGTDRQTNLEEPYQIDVPHLRGVSTGIRECCVDE